MVAVDQSVNMVSALRAQISQGSQPDAKIVVTEYGRSRSAGASDFPGSSHVNLTDALFTSKLIFRWIDLDIPIAERQLLTFMWVLTPPPDGSTILAQWNAMIAGPAPFIVEPTAKVMGQFDRSLGTTKVAATVDGNPLYVSAAGTLPTLEVLASKLADGSTSLIVVNQSPENAVTTTVQSSRPHKPYGERFDRQRTERWQLQHARCQMTVDRVASSFDGGAGSFTYAFAAHSVTSLQLTDVTFESLQEVCLGHEGEMQRYALFHSLALASPVGLLVTLQAYVPPFTSMVLH